MSLYDDLIKCHPSLDRADEYFKQEYMGSFSHIKPLPKHCPVCNRLLEVWEYEKAKAHINKCATKKEVTS